jgi:hypothetical protein
MFGMPPPPEPEPTTASNQQGTRQSVQEYAQELLDEGWTPLQVEQALLSEGLNGKAAAGVVKEVTAQRPRSGKARRPAGGSSAEERRERLRAAAEAEALRQIGRRNMLIGGGICVAGLAITLLSFAAAQSGAGGPVYLKLGAIIGGAAWFIRGASQAVTPK